MWRRGGLLRRIGRPQRERLIGSRLEAMRAGELEPDAGGAGPGAVVPDAVAEPVAADGGGAAEEHRGRCCRLGCGLTLAEPGLDADAPIVVALEDDYGRGAAVAAVAPLDDGRLEVDGWEFADWDSAIDEVEQLALRRHIRELHVGRVDA